MSTSLGKVPSLQFALPQVLTAVLSQESLTYSVHMTYCVHLR